MRNTRQGTDEHSTLETLRKPFLWAPHPVLKDRDEHERDWRVEPRILVIADFGGATSDACLEARQAVKVDALNFGLVWESCRPFVEIDLPIAGNEIKLSLGFDDLSHLESHLDTETIIDREPCLAELRALCADLQHGSLGLTEEYRRIIAILDGFNLSASALIPRANRALIRVREFLAADTTIRRIARSWRSLFNLVQRADGKGVHVEVLDCTKDRLLEDFDDAERWSTSGLYSQLYAGTLVDWPGRPYTAVILDHDLNLFGQRDSEALYSDDVGLLHDCAKVASAAKSLLLCSVQSSRFQQLATARNRAAVATFREGPKAAGHHWLKGLETEEARCVALCGQKLAMTAADDERWTSSVFGLAELVVESLSQWGYAGNVGNSDRLSGYRLLDLELEAGQAAKRGLMAFGEDDHGPYLPQPTVLYSPPAFVDHDNKASAPIRRDFATAAVMTQLLQHLMLLNISYPRARKDSRANYESALNDMLHGYQTLLAPSVPLKLEATLVAEQNSGSLSFVVTMSLPFGSPTKFSAVEWPVTLFPSEGELAAMDKSEESRKEKQAAARKSIEQVARETQEKIMAHMAANTSEEDARREGERDARVRALLERFKEEGNLPGQADKKTNKRSG
jgi:hypothetical protein